MRRTLAVSLIVVFCLSIGSTPAQISKEPAKPDSLEQLQAEALKNNADIKVAEAKLKLAEAVFERVRANLNAKIATAYAEVESTEAAVFEGRGALRRAAELHFKKSISTEELDAVRATVRKLDSDRAVKAAKLQLLVGRPTLKKAQP